MRAKKGFKLRNICGENIIVAEGKENIDFTNIISMNETSAFLWETALNDASELIKQWLEAEIIE